MESALVLPLWCFLILGTLQLFMIQQARLMAQYAAYKAVRAGSTNYGSCLAMTHAAIAAVLPTITRTDSSATLAAGFAAFGTNSYAAAGFASPVVEIMRDLPVGVTALSEDQFDQPTTQPVNLKARVLYWYWMKIPFANWVMERMFLAHFGIQKYTFDNPLNPAQATTNWGTTGTYTLGPNTESWPGGGPGYVYTQMANLSNGNHFVFPIAVTAEMRMLTPPKVRFFPSPPCPTVPNVLELPWQ